MAAGRSDRKMQSLCHLASYAFSLYIIARLFYSYYSRTRRRQAGSYRRVRPRVARQKTRVAAIVLTARYQQVSRQADGTPRSSSSFLGRTTSSLGARFLSTGFQKERHRSHRYATRLRPSRIYAPSRGAPSKTLLWPPTVTPTRGIKMTPLSLVNYH